MGGAARRHDVGQPYRPAHPARADTPLNTVDLTGELLVLRSSSYRTGSYAVLIVKLDLSPLYEMTESWQNRQLQHCRAGFHRQDRAEHL